jgi:hypothetical protein
MFEPADGKHQNWRLLYEAALLELDGDKLHRRIQVAKHAIEARISELVRRSHTQELRDLEDALHNLRSLLRRTS